MQAAAQPTVPHPAPMNPPGRPPEALEALFQQHHGAVYRAAYRITGNASDAEDVLQTVFVRLARRRGNEEPELESDGAGSYLHRAAVNAALDTVRSRKRSRAVALDDVGGDLAEDDRGGPEGRRENRELARRLREALARLSPRQAEIFTLRYFEGIPNLEIARRMASSQTAIAVILHRARHRLQKELGSLQGGMS